MEQPQQFATPPQPPPGGQVALSTQSAQRPRGRTACAGCSKRKIRCDAFERVPCTNCAKRGHHQFCTFTDDAPRSGAKRSRPSQDGASPAAPRPKKQPKTETSPSLPSFLDGRHSASASYSQDAPPSTSSAPWQSRAPAALNGMTSLPTNAPQKSYNVVPAYPTPYQPYQTAPAPQYPPRAPPGPFSDLFELLPSHKTVLRYFDSYKALCHPIYPVITDIEDFENAVCRYVEDVSSGRLNYDLSTLSGRALSGRLSWFALLTATVATGVQYGDMAAAERNSSCTRSLRNAAEILRMADYMDRPDENCVAALLLISRTMENDLKPEAAWSSLGLVSRLSELAGLQSGMSFDKSVDVKSREVVHLRHRKLWWSYLWSESALALVFGKDSVLEDSQGEPPVTTSTSLTYNDCMLLLYKLAFRARPDEKVERSNLKSEIEALAAARHINEKALPRLNDRQNCRTIQDRIEYYSLRISQGFIVSCMSQTLMKACTRQGWDSQRKSLQSMCKEGALDCLQAFVDMQSFSVVPSRTWIYVFSAVNSALVLAAIAEDGDKNKVQELQRQLLSGLAERDRENDLPNRPGWYARYPKTVQLLQQVSGSEENSVANGRRPSSTEQDEKSPEKFLRDMLDPAAMWEGLFSEKAAGMSHPGLRAVVGT